jgi:BirA family transcriptional regulator, biotin operon repressor / biotin---[acetyl-CoA-carboxylase] ligase
VKLDAAWVRRQFPGREIHWFDSIGSTMTEAGRLAEAGRPEGTVVGADEQTAGVGRHGHTWHSEPGHGLYVSIVLRRTLPIPTVTLAIGLAAREAIVETTGIECDLRWPNDLLIGDRKCTGILTSLEAGAIVAGIGINVNHEEFPPDLESLATSLRLASGREHSRETLLVALLRRIDHWIRCKPPEVLAEFARRSSYARGKRVSVDGETIGTTAGLDPQGFLLLNCDNGQTVRILAGGVRPL